MTIIGWLDSTNDGASFIYEMEPLIWLMKAITQCSRDLNASGSLPAFTFGQNGTSTSSSRVKMLENWKLWLVTTVLQGPHHRLTALCIYTCVPVSANCSVSEGSRRLPVGLNV